MVTKTWLRSQNFAGKKLAAKKWQSPRNFGQKERTGIKNKSWMGHLNFRGIHNEVKQQHRNTINSPSQEPHKVGNKGNAPHPKRAKERRSRDKEEGDTQKTDNTASEIHLLRGEVPKLS